MKVSKLFHWLYAILMLLPFIFFVAYVIISWGQNGYIQHNVNDVFNDFYISWVDGDLSEMVLDTPITSIYEFLFFQVFVLTDTNLAYLLITLLGYWTYITLAWLVFDLFMYVPLLAHRWIDRGMLE